MKKILIIDDAEKLRGLLARVTRLEGYEVFEAADLKSGKQFLHRQAIDVVLCDVKLPDGNGVDFINDMKLLYPHLEIILLTAYGNIPDAVQAMKNGALDYITKGDDNEKIIPLLNNAMEKVQLRKRVLELEQQLKKRYDFSSILGKSPLIKEALTLAKKVAQTDATVLLLGETGTGKEVFAQAIHHASKRNGRSFVAINCSAFSKDLLESELFGHAAGAFTGAIKEKKGLVEEADNGTLFLDEIGEMNIGLQAKLLRFLETCEFIRVGETKTSKVSVRLIAATNKNLPQHVIEGSFREDLFYRLNIFTIDLPALRERKTDIPDLADFFIKMFAVKLGVTVTGMAPEFITKLQQHNWKGNIRELKNVIERAIILADSNELDSTSLPFDFEIMPMQKDGLSAFSIASMEKLHIQRVLNHTKSNKTEAARLLDIGLTTLYRKIEEYGLN